MELVVLFTTKLIKFYCKNFGKDAYKEKNLHLCLNIIWIKVVYTTFPLNIMP